MQNEAMFNAARFLANTLGKRQPTGINQVYVYYTLSKLAYEFEAFKTARYGYEKLNSMKLPDQWMEDIEVDGLKIKCKPNSDRDGFQMNTNPLSFLVGGDNAAGIGIPTIHNLASFDSLPLIEFRLGKNIAPKRALELLRSDPPAGEGTKPVKKGKSTGGVDQWGDEGVSEQVMAFGDNADEMQNDLFMMHLM